MAKAMCFQFHNNQGGKIRMKALRFLIYVLLATQVVCQAQITGPGWFHTGIQPSSAQSRSSFTNQSQVQAQSLTPPQPSTPVAEAITPQIQALADGLQDNPQRIFDYVHDHIKFVLYFGSKKGAQLTLLEKSGNDFDQSALLVALLRAAGYTNAPGSDHGVGYQFGWMAIPYDDPSGYGYDLHHWWQLTLNNSNWTNTSIYLHDLCDTRGYPTAYAFADVSVFELQRTWGILTIGATTYNLNPAFKITAPFPEIALPNALGPTIVPTT